MNPAIVPSPQSGFKCPRGGVFVCQKACYTKKGATTVMRQVMCRRKNRPMMIRSYYCRRCNAWHLTHKELRDGI